MSAFSRNSDYDFGPYISVAQKKKKALKKLEDLKKKQIDIEPVIIEGNSLAYTWWGISWNKNLERYADFNYRLQRGRSYVRHNAVINLKILNGEITALVQGTSSKPYNVHVSIKPLQQECWDKIREKCSGKIETLQPLLEGRFSKELRDIFFEKDSGLFPSPAEISYKCNCLDFASMCKHISAALYGVGSRLDQKPFLLFTLRNIDANELITKTLKEKTDKLLKKSKTKSTRIMADSDIGKVFGIELNASARKTKNKKKLQNKDKKIL